MRLLYLSSSPEDLRFINKFSGIFSDINCIHTSLFSYFYKSILDFENSYHKLCFRNNEVDPEGFEISGLSKFNVQTKLLKPDEVLPNASGFYKTIESVILEQRFDLAVIPSGRMLSQKILRDLALKYKIPSLFIGYGNYPGKTFIDHLGTDFASSLRSSRNLERFDGDASVWARGFLDQKRKQPKPRQAKKIGLKKLQRVLRFLLCKAERLVKIAHDTNYKLSDVCEFVFEKPMTTRPRLSNLKEMDFIFFPCQLSSDAQLILNSEVGNLEAIEIASKQAKNEKRHLLIKLHPAETNSKHLNDIFLLKEQFNFEISDENTYEILERCSSVITINSTVGIEALAIGKKVKTLGNAVYEKWDTKQAIQYFEKILFDIDYFSDEKIASDEWQKIVQRFDL